MSARSALGLLVVVGALAVVTAVAQAGPDDRRVASSQEAPYAEKVSITSAVDGPFTAIGHSLCSSGEVATTFNFFLGSEPDGFNLVVGKKFSCDDERGTFDMTLYVHVRPAARRNDFRWMITEATGAFEGLLGAGTGFGDYSDPAVDYYTGRVR